MRTHLNRKRRFRVRTCSQCPHFPREGGSSEINGVGLGLATPRRAPWRGPSCVRERGRHLPALTPVPPAGEIGGKMGGQARPCGHEGAAVTGTRRRRCHAKPAAPREKWETGTPHAGATRCHPPRSGGTGGSFRTRAGRLARQRPRSSRPGVSLPASGAGAAGRRCGPAPSGCEGCPPTRPPAEPPRGAQPEARGVQSQRQQ